MNNPIKFRGFRVETNEPVYGNLLYNGNYYSIREVESDEGFHKTYLVEPESVGMFTGLTDKNGKEIYGAIGDKGGDVVQSDWGYGSTPCSVVLDEITYAKIECTISDNIEIIGNQWEVNNGK